MGIKIPVNFKGVEQRGSVRVPEGDYIAQIVKVEKKTAKSSGNPMLVITFEFQSGPSDVQGKTVIDRHILVKDSLWTLRNMLEAIGYKVPQREMKLDADKMLMKKKVGITVVDGDEYKGRIKSEVADYLPVSAVGNMVRGDEDSDLTDEDEEEDDGLGDFDSDDESDDTSDDESEDESWDESDDDSDDESDDGDDEEDDDNFVMEDDEEDEDEEEVELSFGPDDLDGAKAEALKGYLKEAMDAGFEFDLPSKPKKADVKAALESLFDTEDDEEEDEMDDFSLDDV